jgi:phosphatidate cytidylyltransferase
VVRLAAGAILAALAFAGVVWLPDPAFRVAVCVVAALAAHEYGRLAGAGPGASSWLLVCAVVAACWIASSGRAIDPAAAGGALLAWATVEVLVLGRTMQQAGAGLFATLYIGLPLGLVHAVREAAHWPGAALLIATVIVSDTAQFYTGRLLGRRRLAPSISPNKTVEGAAGGLVAAGLFMALAGARVFPGSPVLQLALLGAALSAVGICGDLVESGFKRAAGLKDSASLIPGHGGVLDRIDALLFASPAFYLYLEATG